MVMVSPALAFRSSMGKHFRVGLGPGSVVVTGAVEEMGIVVVVVVVVVVVSVVVVVGVVVVSCCCLLIR